MIVCSQVATEGAVALVAVAAQTAEYSVPGPTMGKKDEDRMKTKSAHPPGQRVASEPTRSGHLRVAAFVAMWKRDQGMLADAGLVGVFELGRGTYHEECRRGLVVE